eukprot:1572885-Rhodomonas_salina.2
MRSGGHDTAADKIKRSRLSRRSDHVTAADQIMLQQQIRTGYCHSPRPRTVGLGLVPYAREYHSSGTIPMSGHPLRRQYHTAPSTGVDTVG